MADAIPVTPAEVPFESPAESPVEAPKKTKKGASAGIPAEVLQGIQEQAEPAIRYVVDTESPFKIKGGLELANHEAVREDF